jgi:hypothetical protein
LEREHLQNTAEFSDALRGSAAAKSAIAEKHFAKSDASQSKF